MFPGGIADKLGNRFEAKWTVQKLFEVLFGEAESLCFESINPENHGIEFCLTRQGKKEWHQTKRQEGSGNWTVNRLEREGVLTAAFEKLTASDDNIFIFVSEAPAKGLQDLPGKAEIAQNWQQFEDTLSEEQRTEIAALKRVWGISTEDCWHLLRRCRFEVVSESTLLTHIRLFAGLTFNEPQDEAFPLLREYLESNFNRELRTENVRKELFDERGLSPRAHLDATLRERIVHATQRYLDSYCPFGAGGKVISRSQANAVIGRLLQKDGPEVVLLTGNAGSGKSGVVRQVVEHLNRLNVLQLAFRVDRRLDIRTTTDLGLDLFERREDPIVTLRSLAGRDTSVLIIDQIDAVSEASGRVGPMRDVVFELVRMARASGSVRVLAVCRTFDLTNDQALRSMEQSEQVCRVDVAPLDWELEVKPLLLEKEADPELLTPSQRILLSLPLNLNLFFEVLPPATASLPFTSASDLFTHLIERKQREIRERGHANLPIAEAIAAMANAMSEDQMLDAPAAVLDGFPNAVDILAGEHLIIKDCNRVAFFHETFFDYAYARSFVRERKRLLDFLASDEQFLFRRTQVRQILAEYRQSGSRTRYLTELKDVLTSHDVRYHLKEAVARWLATVDDPGSGELDVVLALDDESQRMPTLVILALFPQAKWFPLLQQRGLWLRWLESECQDRQENAFGILRTAVREFPAEVATILRRWWSGRNDRAGRLLGWVSWLPDAGPSPELLALNLDVIRSNPPELLQRGGHFDRLSLSTWLKKDPKAAGEVLKTWFEKWFETFPEGHPFLREYQHDLDNHWVKELRDKSPDAFLDVAVPVFVKTIDRINQTFDGQHWKDYTWLSRYERIGFGSDFFLGLLRSAFSDIAKRDPEQAERYLQQIDPCSHPSSLYLHLETIAMNGVSLGSRLTNVLSCARLFDAGPSGASWLSFARAAKAALPSLSQEARFAVEGSILSNWSEINHAKWIANELAKGGEQGWPFNRRVAISYLNDNGYEQWCILKTVGSDLLSPEANARFAVLDRKFKRRSMDQPSNPEAKFVPPPISQKSAAFMSDQQWIRAMRAYPDDRETMRAKGRWSFHTGASGLAHHVLRERAKEEPERFAGLLLKLPGDVARDYANAILNGLAESHVHEQILLQAVKHSHSLDGKPYCGGISRIFETHPALGHDNEAFDVLKWYVMHGNAETDGERDKKRVEDETVNIAEFIRQGQITHIRGVYNDRGMAAEALGAVLWECEERLEEGCSFLDHIVSNEPLLSIRCALTSPIYSILRYDNAKAAGLQKQLVFRTDGIDLIPLATYDGISLLTYILHGTPEVGRELMSALLDSRDENLQRVGAFHLIREGFYDKELAERADALIAQDEVCRQIAADVAANHLLSAEYQDRAENLLISFFEDSVTDVRKVAANCFRNLKGEDVDRFRPLLRKFMQSKAFEEENFGFFLLLKETACETVEEVVLAAERLMELVEQNAKKENLTREMHYLDDLIRREYAAVADRPDLRRRLLDVIDRMLIWGIYGTDDIIKDHERL